MHHQSQQKYVDEKVLKFKGDEGEAIFRKLDSQLNILEDGRGIR